MGLLSQPLEATLGWRASQPKVRWLRTVDLVLLRLLLPITGPVWRCPGEAGRRRTTTDCPVPSLGKCLTCYRLKRIPKPFCSSANICFDSFPECCEWHLTGFTLRDVKPLAGVVESIRHLYASTSRYMTYLDSCSMNVQEQWTMNNEQLSLSDNGKTVLMPARTHCSIRR